jgi:hypothetical protein
MNSERLKDFRQAAYELLVQALVCNIRADGFSDDHQKCVMFSGIFTQSIIQASMASASMKHYKTVDQTEKN